MTTIVHYFKEATQHNRDAWFLCSETGEIIAQNPVSRRFTANFEEENPTNLSRLLLNYNVSDLFRTIREQQGHTQLEANLAFENNSALVEITHLRNESDTASYFQVKATQPPSEKQEAFLQNQKILLAAQSVAKVGSWQYDFRSGALEWTPELFKIFGLDQSADNPTLQQFWDRIHPEDFEYYSKTIDETIKNSGTYSVDHRIIKPNGEVSYLQCSGETILDEQGNAIGLFGMSLDITERKLVEDSLQQALSMNQKIMNYSLEIICTLDRQGNFLSVNRACESIWGYTPDEMKDKNYLDFIYQEDIEKTQRLGGGLFTGKPTSYLNNLYVHKDGRLVSMIWSVNWSETDQVLFCVARDITHLQEAEAEVMASNKRFHSMVQNGSDLIALLSPEGEYIYVSNSAYTILGYYPEDLLSKTPFDYIHPDDVLRVAENFEAIKTQPKLNVMPFRFKAADGEWRWIETIISNHCDDPEIGAFIASSRDITQRRLADLQLLQSEQRYKSLFDNHPDAVFSLDKEGNFMTANNQVAIITGYPISKIIKSNFRSLIVPEFAEGTVTYFSQALQGVPQTYETAIFTLKGPPIAIKVTSIPIIVDDEIIGVYGIAKNISERNLAIKERQELVTRLEQRNKSLQQFAYIISHNLRAPVANIMGLTNLLEKESTDVIFQQRIVKKLAQSSLNLDSIIKDLNQILLAGSQINDLNETIYFSDIVEAIKISLAADLQQHQVTLKTDFARAPAVNTVKSYLNSILYNLLNNAIKYQSEERLLIITITSYIHDDYICLSVQDNGLGIDLQKQKDHIFGLYKRFHPKIEGKGLGLHLIKNQVEAMGGKVEVESEVGIGSKFNVYFKNNL